MFLRILDTEIGSTFSGGKEGKTEIGGNQIAILIAHIDVKVISEYEVTGCFG